MVFALLSPFFPMAFPACFSNLLPPFLPVQGRTFELNVDVFALFSLLFSIIITYVLLASGKSTWLSGVSPTVIYVVIAVAYFYQTQVRTRGLLTDWWSCSGRARWTWRSGCPPTVHVAYVRRTADPQVSSFR